MHEYYEILKYNIGTKCPISQKNETEKIKKKLNKTKLNFSQDIYGQIGTNDANYKCIRKIMVSDRIWKVLLFILS